MTETVQWYQGSFHRTLTKTVTIEKTGTLAIPDALMAQWPADSRFARIGRRQASLIICPVVNRDAGALTIQRQAQSHRSGRIAAAVALRELGVPIGETRACPALWKDGWIVVSIADAATPKPEIVSDLESEEDLDNQPGDLEDIGLPLKIKRTCETCWHWTGVRCRCETSRKYGLAVGAGDGCDQHVRRPPGNPPVRNQPNPDAEGGKRMRQGSRPRGRCSASDHGGATFPISAKGVYPHDVDGVMYCAGKGDHEKICPGSNRPPKEVL